MCAEAIGIGIIGCGKIARVQHIPGYAADPRCRLVGYYNPTASRAEEMSRKYGGKVYSSLEELLADKDIAAVSVCTPNTTHAEIAVKAMLAGKHVLCEKPMAVTLEECEEMLRISRLSGKKLMIGQNQRLAGAHTAAKAMIEQGKLGRLLSFRTEFGHSGPENWSITPGSGTWFFDRKRAAMGAMADLGIHKTDLIQYLTGSRVIRTTARLAALDKCGPDGERITVDDNAICIYELSDGSIGTMTASWTRYGGEDNSTVIYGTEGELRIYDDPRQPLVFKGRGGEIISYDTEPIQTNDIQLSSGIIELWLDCIANDTEPAITAESVIPAMRAVFASVKSSETQRTIDIPENM